MNDRLSGEGKSKIMLSHLDCAATGGDDKNQGPVWGGRIRLNPQIRIALAEEVAKEV